MSKFKEGRVYIIAHDDDITQAMINYSTSKSKSEMPSKTVTENLLPVTYRILETSEPVNMVYEDFTWYDKDEVIPAWDAIV